MNRTIGLQGQIPLSGWPCGIGAFRGRVMRNSELVFAAVVAIGAMASLGTAGAADLPARPYSKAPAVVPVAVYSWTGCYLGAEGGGIWGSANNYSFDPLLTGNLTNSYSLSGGMAGGTVGCNYQSGQFVFGIEGDGSWTNKSGSDFAIPPFSATANVQTRENWIATFRGRLGWAFDDRWLVYVTGGGAATNAKLTLSDTAVGLSASQANTRWGWTVGAGVEWAFAGNWSAKLEYLHADFGNSNYFAPDITVPVGNIVYTFLSQRVHLTDDMVRVGVNYRFDWGAPVVARY
jgi:outer membrane immunogenic protein